MRTVRFAVFVVLSWAAVLVYGVALFAVTPFGRRYAYAVARSWCWFVTRLARVICGLRYRVVGRENIPDTACVLYLKHSSALETFAQLVEFPRNVWVLKRELLWVPVFGWALWILRSIAIDRSAGRTAVRQVVEQGRDRLERGICVSVFPEGTRMPPGTTRRYGISGVVLAQETGRLIVPIAHNAGYHWPKHGSGITPGEVVFVVGEPLDPSGCDPREFNERVQAWMEAEVAAIVNGER